jgi:hypothetical protein
MKRESNQEIELKLLQLGIHVERATHILSVLLNLRLSARFKYVRINTPSSCWIGGTPVWFTKRIACVTVSRNMATLNWRGARVFLTYRALEIALHYFFCFWPRGCRGKIKYALGNLKNGSSNSLQNLLQSSDGSWPWLWTNWYTWYEFDPNTVR